MNGVWNHTWSTSIYDESEMLTTVPHPLNVSHAYYLLELRFVLQIKISMSKMIHKHEQLYLCLNIILQSLSINLIYQIFLKNICIICLYYLHLHLSLQTQTVYQITFQQCKKTWLHSCKNKTITWAIIR